MLEVLRPQNEKGCKPCEISDTIVNKYETKVTYEKDGTMITRRVAKPINVTKLVNESKKLLKKDTAQETLKKLEEIIAQESKTK